VAGREVVKRAFARRSEEPTIHNQGLSCSRISTAQFEVTPHERGVRAYIEFGDAVILMFIQVESDTVRTSEVE
jgi:hypothetical protein